MTSDDDEVENNTIERHVWLVLSPQLSKISDLLPSNIGRQSLITSLIEAYDLPSKCQGIVPVVKATKRDLETYHDKEFISFLLKRRIDVDQSLENYNEIKSLVHLPVYKLDNGIITIHDKEDVEQAEDDEEEDSTEQLQKYGLLHDCYPFPFMSEYVKLIAGSTLSSARTLIQLKQSQPQSHNIVINWYGGRHHCHKSKVAGFCYINDIILSIQLFRKHSFSKIFYLDLDLHHGNGVENAYKLSKNVFTCSIHRYDIGFYPGTGSLESSTPKMINIPTKRGLNDISMMKIIKTIVMPIMKHFDPQVLIIQSGCDGLSTDEHNEWNLSIRGIGNTIDYILDEINHIPTLILGGGGYNHTETAKCWTHITQKVLQNDESYDIIPEHPYLDAYEKDNER
ncbi:histone deacetylase [Scheffersomyces coipomensis]|uniref:histone deacetylase n=1 Tax=Scheffersomyces coipomensis TaxID=1788519 RepID=UPI00315DCC00